MKTIVILMVFWTLCPLWADAQIIHDDKHPVAEAINKAYSYTYFFPFDTEGKISINYEQMRKELDKRYAEVKAEVDKMALR